MESVKTKIRQVILTSVFEIKPATDGWWFHFEGSRESLYFQDKWAQIGDKIKITFERIP